jgi:hypothetical protein
MSDLAKAILCVMKEVKGIDKTLTVGTGNSSYKGVPDQEVKKILGESMAKNGLCVLPIEIDEQTQIDRWEEVDTYSKEIPKPMKQKQSVFTKVKTKYLLLHESGESQVIVGYGHGVDSQDKGAGKATTYALKYAMLYSFFVPTGKIDDTDTDHSDSKEVAVKPQPQEKIPQKPLLTDVQFDSLMKMDALQLMPLIPRYEEKFIIKPDWLTQLKAKK